MLIERKKIIDHLMPDFGTKIKISRDFINPRVLNYPDYVSMLLFENQPLPFFIINKILVHKGSFPNYEDLKDIILNIPQLQNF